MCLLVNPIPDTDAIVLVSEQHPSATIVIVGGDGASVPSVVLQASLGGLHLAATLDLIDTQLITFIVNSLIV